MQSKRPLRYTSRSQLHFGRRSSATMQQLTLLLLILGFAHAVHAAAIFEFPDLTRRLPERTTTPGCAYKGERYVHGEQVGTTEPCLNCTCIRAVVVCYLRVCPSPSSPPSGCFLAREVGQCCPSLVCGGDEKSKPSEVDSDLRPTFQPEPPKDDTTTTTTTTTDAISTTTDDFENSSLMFVSSTIPEDEIPFLNDIPGGCLVNGTLYGDGSAMLSSSFCEYCFCIRGKTTCLKPKCDLVIEGCAPHYDSQFSCCPSKYHCFQKTSTTDMSEKENFQALTVPSTTTITGITKFSDDYGTCILDGIVYRHGEVVPDYRKCQNCYCSEGSIICDKIKCAPALAGCLPIIPEDHCCPVSYKCDYHKDSGNYNIKATRSNDSNSEIDLKRTDVKTVKQSEYFKNNHALNLETRPQSPGVIDDLASFFHNFVPIHRRLDEDTADLYNSPDEDININFNNSEHSTSSQINIGQSTTPQLRENDKTLDLEEVKLMEETTPSHPQREDHKINHNYASVSFDSTSSVSVGPPEVQTYSFHELFEQLFGKNNITDSKHTTEDVNKPKRNNSKRPSNKTDSLDTETITPSTLVTTPSYSQFEDNNYDNVSSKTTLLLSDNQSALYKDSNENATESTIISSPSSVSTEQQYDSTTPVPLKIFPKKETTVSGALITTTANKNSDSTMVHTTLNFAEDETIPHNGISPYIITGQKNNRIYRKTKGTSITPNWYVTDSISTTEVFPSDTILDDINSTQITKSPNRINSKLPADYSKTTEDSVLNSTYRLAEESLVNLYLPAEGRDGDSNDFTNVGAIHLGAPLSVEATELRRDPANLRNKITESGGVIFMDPKYTDINPNLQIENLTQPTEISSIQSTSSDSTKSSVTPIERSDTNNVHYDRKKGPRIQDVYNQTNPGQDYKIIPFVAEDAIRGKFGKVNNTFHVISDSTQSVPDMVSDFCFIKGRIFMNGEMIPKVDPCELCRCFYGQELCQLQRCPTTPPNCVPEKLPAFCCPRFTCGSNSSFKEQSPPPQKITINAQPNSQFHRPIIDYGTVEKPELTSPKQEDTKFGTRVRLRPTQSSKLITIPKQEMVPVTEHSTTVAQIETRRTTGIHMLDNKRATTSKLSELGIKTTKDIQHDRLKLTTTRQPDIYKTTKKVPISPFSDPWGLLKVSGCNIYGKFFNINDQVEILSGPCSHCICTTNGVECNDIC